MQICLAALFGFFSGAVLIYVFTLKEKSIGSVSLYLTEEEPPTLGMRLYDEQGLGELMHSDKVIFDVVVHRTNYKSYYADNAN